MRFIGKCILHGLFHCRATEVGAGYLAVRLNEVDRRNALYAVDVSGLAGPRALPLGAVPLHLPNGNKRAKQILAYPWFDGKKHSEKEIKRMLKNGFKMEVEAMCSKYLTFVTDEYAPARIKDRKTWLD